MMNVQDKIARVLASYGVNPSELDQISAEVVSTLGLKEVSGHRVDTHIDYIDSEVPQGFVGIHLAQKGGVEIKRLATEWEEVGEWQEPDPDHDITDDEPQVTFYKSDHERNLKVHASDTLNSAVDALNKEAIGFQSSWGSNPEDVAKLEAIGKTITWLEQRALKYLDTLPRTIYLRDEYKTLSDGAVIEIEGEKYQVRKGFGLLTNRKGEDIVAREHVGPATLISHNL